MSEKQSRRLEGEEETTSTIPQRREGLVKVEFRLPDASRHEIEFPAAMTAGQLTDELAQHFNLDKYRWNLLLGTDDKTIYPKRNEILSDLIAKSNNAYLYFYPQIAAG